MAYYRGPLGRTVVSEKRRCIDGLEDDAGESSEGEGELHVGARLRVVRLRLRMKQCTGQ